MRLASATYLVYEPTSWVLVGRPDNCVKVLDNRCHWFELVLDPFSSQDCGVICTKKKKKHFSGAVIVKFNMFVYCGNWRIIEKFQCLSCNYQYRGERNMWEEFLSYFGRFFFFFHVSLLMFIFLITLKILIASLFFFFLHYYVWFTFFFNLKITPMNNNTIWVQGYRLCNN